MTNLMKNTKQALCAMLIAKGAEVYELRKSNDELSTALEALRAMVATNSRRGTSAATSQRPTRVHEYATHEEAVVACRHCVASPSNANWTFSVQGNKVIAAARAW